jgi:magnesium transporter
MSTVLASGLEVLQSIYNNQLQMLNNRLAMVVVWLTVLGTVVLVPNTIATIFGIGTLAEDLGHSTIFLIIALSTIISAILAYLYGKKLLADPKS